MFSLRRKVMVRLLLLVTSAATIAIAFRAGFLTPLLASAPAAAASTSAPTSSAVLLLAFGVMVLASALVFRPLFALAVVRLTMRFSRVVRYSVVVVGGKMLTRRLLAAVFIDRNLLTASLAVFAAVATAASAPPAATPAWLVVAVLGGR
jgi:hypothetical protein